MIKVHDPSLLQYTAARFPNVKIGEADRTPQGVRLSSLSRFLDPSLTSPFSQAIWSSVLARPIVKTLELSAKEGKTGSVKQIENWLKDGATKTSAHSTVRPCLSLLFSFLVSSARAATDFTFFLAPLHLSPPASPFSSSTLASETTTADIVADFADVLVSSTTGQTLIASLVNICAKNDPAHDCGDEEYKEIAVALFTKTREVVGRKLKAKEEAAKLDLLEEVDTAGGTGDGELKKAAAAKVKGLQQALRKFSYMHSPEVRLFFHFSSFPLIRFPCSLLIAPFFL